MYETSAVVGRTPGSDTPLQVFGNNKVHEKCEKGAALYRGEGINVYMYLTLHFHFHFPYQAMELVPNYRTHKYCMRILWELSYRQQECVQVRRGIQRVTG
jgi:hypothetical protein